MAGDVITAPKSLAHLSREGNVNPDLFALLVILMQYQ